MPDVRAQLVGAVRAELGLARGAARARFMAARDDLRAAHQRLQQAKQAEGVAPAALGDERDDRLRAAEEAHRARVADLARAAVAAVPAGCDGIRIGEVRPADLGAPAAVPVPALVPLLDRTHLLIDAAPGSLVADGLLATIAVRLITAVPPGGVRLIGYDPERLGARLAAFAPLAEAGLLTYPGPTGLAGVLDELADEIRRITTSVLAGRHTNMREHAEATGRRTEPWRVAVLLGTGQWSTNVESARHEQAQLSRVLRTGAACGVHVVACGVPVVVTDAVTVVTLSSPFPDAEGAADGESGVDGGTARAFISLAPELPVTLDAPPAAAAIAEACEAIASACAPIGGSG